MQWQQYHDCTIARLHKGATPTSYPSSTWYSGTWHLPHLVSRHSSLVSGDCRRISQYVRSLVHVYRTIFALEPVGTVNKHIRAGWAVAVSTKELAVPDRAVLIAVLL